MSAKSRRAAVLSPLVGIVALLFTAGMSVFIASRSASPTGTGVAKVPTNGDLAYVLARAGLLADRLAASGINAAQTTAMVSAVRSNLPELNAAIRAGDEAFANAQKEVDRLSGLVTAGAATEQDVAALATARATLTNATAQLNAAIADVREASGLDGAVLATLARFENALSDGLPVWYRADDNRPEASWLTLRHALASERINTRLNREVPGDAQQVITAADGDGDIAAAHAAYELNHAEVEAAWNGAVFPQ